MNFEPVRLTQAELYKFLYLEERLTRLEIEARGVMDERQKLIDIIRETYALKDGDSFDKQSGIIIRKEPPNGPFK